jgi:hypothetical protein
MLDDQRPDSDARLLLDVALTRAKCKVFLIAHILRWEPVKAILWHNRQTWKEMGAYAGLFNFSGQTPKGGGMTMHGTTINNLQPGDEVNGVYALCGKKLLPYRDGTGFFLRFTLADKTGRVEGVVWDRAEEVNNC